MWIETDHHGLINLSYVKRIDLTGDVEKKTYGVYVFDSQGEMYPLVDMSRFDGIGVLEGRKSEDDLHVAMYTFYMVARKLIADSRGDDVVTIESIYKEFASLWYREQKKGGKKAPEKEQKGKDKPVAGEGRLPASVHTLGDLKLFLDAYRDRYHKKLGRKPLISYRAEGRIADELLKLYPLKKLKMMLSWYFDSEEEFITRANYSMETFKTILDRAQKAIPEEE